MRRKKLLLFSLILLCLPTYSQAQTQPWSGIIDPSRAIDWTNVGTPGGIPNRTITCATLDPGATAAAINDAIASCPSGQVVKLNAGTYNLSSGIVFNNKSDVTLRGAGPDQTFLIFTGGNACGGLGGDLCFINGDANWSGDPRNVANWTAGYAVGATSITLDDTTNLQVGSLLILDQLDDSTTDTGEIWVCQTINVCSQQGGSSNGRTNRAQNQVVKVTSISSGSCPCTIEITPGLYMPNWRASQQPQAWWSNSLPISGSGVEDLSMDHSNTASGINAGTFFFNAYGSWFKNIRDINSREKHIWMYQSAHLTVRDSYFYGTHNAASDSYGTDEWIASDNLIENNIFQHITAPMMNEDGHGTVQAYNYSVDDYYYVSSWQQSSSYHHAAGNAFLLWEGNSGSGLTADDIHGSSHFITAFRNYWTGRDIPTKTQETIAVHLEAYNRYYNIIGNVLGTAGYHTQYESAPSSPTDPGSSANGNVSIYTLGYSANEGTYWSGPPAILNDLLTKSTMMRWGNYDTVNAAVLWNASEVPSGLSQYANPVPADNNLPNSFYLSAKPSWWAASIPWPAIGPDVTGGQDTAGHAYKIPAHVCYDNSQKNADGTLIFNADNCYGNNPPPSISMTEPAAGSTVAGTVTVSASASSNVGVTSVQFQLDGADLGAALTSAPYVLSWNTATVPNGTHSLTAVARDAAGNTATSSAVTVTVSNGPPPDTTPPTVTITSPASGATVSGTITVSADASDNAGVVGVQFFLDGANLGAELTAAPYTLSWDTTSVNNGTHTLTAVARDAADNRTTSAGVTVTVSNGSATVTRFKEADPAVSYAGNWYHPSDPRRTGGTAEEALEAAAQTTLSFTGTAASWIGRHNQECGIARVSVDRTFVGEVDTYAPSVEAQTVVFTAAGLPRRAHTLTIEVTGTATCPRTKPGLSSMRLM